MGKKGFTLIELMIVVLIVAILAAVALPLMMNRADAAKWTEGRATMGTIAMNLKAWYAQNGANTTLTPTIGGGGAGDIGVSAGDLSGTYFNSGDYTFSVAPAINTATGVITGTISCTGTKGNSPTNPTTVTLTLSSNGQVFNPP